ncbi:MAG TPA: HlyD family efflux transporter periplasmic adaptor subunit [Solirubrobacteraceae bacterium]|jgi:macrolide-specific efflux system membrane fusion protein
MTRTRSAPPWPSILLGLLCLAAIAAAALLVGPASARQRPAGRLVTVSRGVVQSTVSGSGNVQAASQLNLGFKAAGVVSQIDVRQGEHVTEGKLLAELDPKSAEVALEQARASQQQAEANLLQAQQTSERSATASAPTRAGAGTASTTVSPALREADISSAKAAVRSDALAVQSAEATLADTRLYAPQTGTIVSLSGEVGETAAANGTTRASGSSTASSTATGKSGGGDSGESSVSGSGASAAAALGGAGAGAGGASSGSGSSSASSSSPFAVLSDLSSMQLVVPLSESEVGGVHPGQPATVTVEALEGTKLAAHVVSVATLPTSSSGVVSYDVTFQLDQLASGLKPGMSATAEVVVKQAEGVNVPTSAIAAGTVTVVHDGSQARRRIVTGLAGNSSTVVLSGLRAGEEILLPVARTSAASLLGSRLGGALAGRLGGGGPSAAGLGGGGAIGLRGGLRGG